MSSLAGPLHLVALVLVISGAQKMLDPSPPSAAMATVGLPRWGAALGVAEVVIGLAALAVPTWWTAALLAISFLGFAGFVLRLRRVDGSASCGCFGSSSAPPTTTHVLVNLAAAAAATAAAIVGPADLLAVVDAGVAVAIPYVLLVLVGAVLVLSAPGLLADRGAAVRPAPVRLFGPVR